MSSKIRSVALLLPAFVLATGLASAQGVKVSTVGSNGAVTSNNITPTTNGPGAKAPFSTDGNAKYWDGLGLGGASTNYFTQVPYIVQTPNPQIAVGPDDILTIVNRTISRYPNPNAAGNIPTIANPYNNPPTEFIPLDIFLGLATLGGNPGIGTLCPSGTSSNSTCVIDNASIRYDQLQGRFVILFTVTDLPSHRSNWILVVSKFAQLQQCPVPNTIGGPVCQTPIFTPPVIAPIVGGTSTGGVNGNNWNLYRIPINLLYNPLQQPNALGLVNAPGAITAPAPFNTALTNSATGTLNTISTGGASVPFLTTSFCPNGGPQLPLTYGNGVANGTAGGTGRSCTNYYPTGARFGLDNDNIILTAPVLDMAYAANEGNFPSTPGQNLGPYVGTRVTTVSKLQVYNAQPFVPNQPGIGPGNTNCLTDNPIDCLFVNLSDNAATGTLTEVATRVAFAQGALIVGGGSNGKLADLQYTAGPSTTNPTCFTSNPVALVPAAQVPPFTAAQAVLSCAPLSTLTRALPAIFWEPDNLRGRALATFDAQVAPPGTPSAGVITPIDYLVGTEITDNFGQNTRASGGVPALSSSASTGAQGPTGNCTSQPEPGCAGIISQGVKGITGQALPVPQNTIPLTAGIATIYYLQPIVFSCPSGNLFGKLSSVNFCGSGDPLSADLGVFGPLRANVSTLAQVADPSPVGQGFNGNLDAKGNPTGLTTNPANSPVSSVAQDRIFVGDSRPEQVIFREGLLYIARNVRLADLQINWLGTSTVLYDILKTCAGTSATPAAPICGSFDATGANLIKNPALAFEYEWFNGLNVPDPGGDVLGFGFYQPMFEVPADVVATGPVSPISVLQVFDKLFVGMTTGGTSNTLATFSKNYPSLWDFRPGDDAFDTIQPYLDPYTGLVLGTYNGVCGSSVTQPGSASVTATLVTPGSNQITVNSSANLAISQTVQSGTPVTTAFNPGNPGVTAASTSGADSNPVGNVATTAFTCTAAAVGCPAGAVSTASFGILSLTNVGPGEAVIGVRGPSVTTNTIQGSTTIQVPNDTKLAIGDLVEAPGIIPQVGNPTLASTNTFVTGITVNPDNTLQVTLSQGALVTGVANVIFDDSPCFGSNNKNPDAATQRVTSTTNNSAFVVGPSNIPGVTYTGTLGSGAAAFGFVGALPAGACSSFYADSTGSNTGQGAIPSLLGTVIDNGIPVRFLASNIVSGSIINIVGNIVTLSANASAPLPSLAAGVSSSNLPVNFQNGSQSGATIQCPIIPFSPRGGASTDPNDGSLWLFGEFAKNRLSTIPGPGQWGTSVANYALSFPAVDPYGNDNTFFQDVQPTGSSASGFFTWIQLAKNLGLAVPAGTGPLLANGGCSANGVNPILQPPAPGTQPVPGPGSLACPTFLPDFIVTRAEMAYWVVRSQMDEQQVNNYLCATGGDPTGLATCSSSPGLTGFTFADVANGKFTNPFIATGSAAATALGVQGVSLPQLQRYIEVMVRRGYTKGCTSTLDPQFNYCPDQPVTRGQMAVFLIRAKMNNVFPTTLSGLPLVTPYGDNFGNFTPTTAYFSDLGTIDASFAPFINKMRELRITNGTTGSTYSPNASLTRKEIATFVVRAFFL